MAAPIPKKQVELGFVEETETFLLKSRFFPSKTGGKPAWLSLNPLPSVEDLSCGVCGAPTSFLLQIYCPILEQTESFHRSLFVFVCKNAECCKPNSSTNLRVFRSQLSKENDFFSSDPPKEVEIQDEIDASRFNKLCVVCGCIGPKTCGRCHKVSYCSKEHQICHWRAGHKKMCSPGSGEASKDTVSVVTDVLFPELELVTETEELTGAKEEKNDSEKLKDLQEFMKSDQGAGVMGDVSEAELDKMATKETENDKQLRKFKKRISYEPEQVLRYSRGGEPLWISSSPIPEEIPDCQCGAKRQFEFQILPQLLSHMRVDQVGASLDWGTLCVYTCSQNCGIGNQYTKEYIFKQDIV